MISNNDPVPKRELFDNGYALIIGIANYPRIGKLSQTVLKDAEDLSEVLKDTCCGYPDSHIRQLLDSQATARGIRAGLQWLSERASKDDTAVFFFSGHGGRVENGSKIDNYLIPYDTELHNLKDTAIDGQELTMLLQQIRAGRLLVLFDSCHAGGVGEIKESDLTLVANLKSGLNEQLYDQLGQGNGRVIIASSRSDEYSWVLPDMQNSLFTHYLLEALRGSIPTRGDGLIRIFDLFDYVSQHVNERYPAQHPILKAELEDNFAISLYLGGKVTEAPSTEGHLHQTIIQNFPNLSLKSEEEDVLVQMFAGYERVVLKAELGGGYSGGRVFMLRPITTRGAELPVAVKLDQAIMIQREWNAFTRFVRQKVPKVAQIEGELVFSSTGAWGGIRYPLAGSGRFHAESLGQYCQHAAVEDIMYVLTQRLFPSINVMWQANRVANEYFFGGSFDPILPVNLIIRSALTANQPIELNPQTVHSQTVQVGTEVVLSNFIIAEVNVIEGELTLDLSTNEDELPNVYRLCITAVPNADQYREGQLLLRPISGIVEATRDTILKKQIEYAFNATIDRTADTLTLPGVASLPNPLPALPHILNWTGDLRVGPIHGDLNLGNILVEYDQKSHDIHLIDFACARYDYVLHDLLRLETSFWLYLVPVEMARNGRSLADLRYFLSALHTNKANPVFGLEKSFRVLQTVREMAQHFLVDPQSWDEYYKGLTIYLLGALTFKNLDDQPTSPLPKQVAFVTAAFIQQPQKEFRIPPISPSSPPSSSGPPLPKSELLRQIRFRLRKLELFESDRELRSVFKNYPELHPWADRLPEASSWRSRADTTVAFLVDRYSADNQNALVIFLQVLVKEYNEGEQIDAELTSFAYQLQSIL